MFLSVNLNQLQATRPFTLLLTGLVQLLLLTTCLRASAQINYYVANTGNDGNNGTTPGTPFLTLDRVRNLNLQAGDSVLFRRGDTFRGTLTIRRSGSANRPIVFAAYGSGQKPVLSGSVPVSNWSNIGGNVWQANCSSCGNTITGLYSNDKALPLGRYPNVDTPNKGYLTIRAHTDKYQIFSQEPFPAGVDFTGGEVTIRSTQWILDRAYIGQQFGNDVLNITNNSNYPLTDGWGYFIQNHPATLDQNGEWYYNGASKTIQLFTSQTNPNSQAITATTQSRVVDGVNISHVALRNLHITQSLNESVFIANSSNFTLVSSDVTNSGEDAISIRGNGNTIVIENNRITDVNNNGVVFDAFQNVSFRGNSLRRVGMVAGRGKGGDGHYNGLQSAANQNVSIENNVIDSIGYNGIQFWNNTLIRQNVISNYCMTKSDGGALYAFNASKATMTNIRIISNIIYNGIGASEGSFRQEYSGANGIFLDDCVENVELRDNTVFNNHQWGIYLHATSKVTAIGNTSFDNRVSQFVMYHNAGYCALRNNVVKNNVFVTKQLTQLAGQYESNVDDLSQYGVVDSNYYARPFNDEAPILGFKNINQGGGLSLKSWNTFSGGLDLNSKSSPVTYKRYKNDGAGGVNRFNSTFETGKDDWFIIYSNYNNVEATQDNTNKLDGGSLRVGLIAPSGKADSYAQVVKNFGVIKKGKTYVLRFDAVASVNINVLAYLRTSGPPYVEYDNRHVVELSTTRKSYELPFTASDDGTDAIVMIQIDGEGPTFWIDNVRLQEDIAIRNDPNELIKLYFNPTLKDTVITLVGTHRDAKNQIYANSFTLKPFTSVILLQSAIVPALTADLSLSLQSDRRVLKVDEPATLRLRVSNQDNNPAALARWTYRLPANLQFIDSNGQPLSDNVLTGTVQQLAPQTDTTFTLRVRPTAAGLFRTAAQLTTAVSIDPDSSPNTGTADGEDDVAVVELRVGESTMAVFESPNPNQRSLPPVVSNQPVPIPNQADLSLSMEMSSRAPAMGEVITCTLYVDNSGGSIASGVQLQNRLPDGFQLVDSQNWTVNGRILNTTLAPIPAGSTISATFRVQVTSMGVWINQAQISASSISDPDSSPGNGFTNGEDDRAEVDVRGR